MSLLDFYGRPSYRCATETAPPLGGCPLGLSAQALRPLDRAPSEASSSQQSVSKRLLPGFSKSSPGPEDPQEEAVLLSPHRAQLLCAGAVTSPAPPASLAPRPASGPTCRTRRHRRKRPPPSGGCRPALPAANRAPAHGPSAKFRLRLQRKLHATAVAPAAALPSALPQPATAPTPAAPTTLRLTRLPDVLLGQPPFRPSQTLRTRHDRAATRTPCPDILCSPWRTPPAAPSPPPRLSTRATASTATPPGPGRLSHPPRRTHGCHRWPLPRTNRDPVLDAGARPHHRAHGHLHHPPSPLRADVQLRRACRGWRLHPLRRPRRGPAMHPVPLLPAGCPRNRFFPAF